MTTAMMRSLQSLLALCALALTAQSPVTATAGAVLPWCTSVPLPRIDTGALTSNVDTQTIHRAQVASCRWLDVSTPRRTVRLAVMTTEPQRERGLMNVPAVPVGQGMLFAFPDADQHREFWMKDTIASLDMVFIAGDGTITSIAPNVPATTFGQTDDQVARRSGTGRYVVEVGAGEAARLGLVSGMRLNVPSIPAK